MATRVSRKEIQERRLKLLGGPEWAIRHFDVDRFYKLDDPPYKGWVYFVQSGGKRGPIKIGYTGNDDIQKRVATLRTANPLPLRLLASVRGNVETEKLLHSMFGMWRMEGEWFRGNALGLLELIEELQKRLPV